MIFKKYCSSLTIVECKLFALIAIHSLILSKNEISGNKRSRVEEIASNAFEHNELVREKARC
jgi:hypothetical protein